MASDWRDDQYQSRKNEKKSAAHLGGHEANVSMMNSVRPGWAYMPLKTISAWENQGQSA